MGIIMAKEQTKGLNLAVNQEILVEVRPVHPLAELFGSGKFSKPTAQLLAESRKNESKFG